MSPPLFLSVFLASFEYFISLKLYPSFLFSAFSSFCPCLRQFEGKRKPYRPSPKKQVPKLKKTKSRYNCKGVMTLRELKACALVHDTLLGSALYDNSRT